MKTDAQVKVACPNCGRAVWHFKAHWLPGNHVTPQGWACVQPAPVKIEHPAHACVPSPRSAILRVHELFRARLK